MTIYPHSPDSVAKLLDNVDTVSTDCMHGTKVHLTDDDCRKLSVSRVQSAIAEKPPEEA